ncbi:MAG TPA: hypothetical protein VGF55_09160 [Gemmataceae bacterium]
MTTSLAAMNLLQYRERYPYDGAALRSMSESEAARQAERLKLPSAGAAALVADHLEQQMLDFERELVRDLGSSAGQDLSDVALLHVLIDSPNAFTLFDQHDRSYAIGLDPGFWHAICFLYWDAALGQRVNDPRWFLVLATKTVGWFWVGSSKDWTEDADVQVKTILQTAPDLWSFGRDLVNTAISFSVAHEVGHIVLGHLEGPHAGSVRLSEEGPASRASAMESMEQERAADAWAAEALFRWAGDDFKKQTLVLSVPALCFCLSALKSQMTAPATNAIARATANSHPSDMDRAQRLHTLAGSHANEVAGSNAMKHFVELGYWVNEQRTLLQREGMQWVPEWFRSRGLA